MSNFPATSSFRSVPKTGVIYVMHRANALGFSYGDPAWANLGQGSPETGPLPDAPPRVDTLHLDPANHRYGPVQGQRPLRQAVADFYNHHFRQGMASQYTWRNVSIAGGGRVALTRLAAALGDVNMGHFLPDYTAYEELLATFKSFVPIPILLSSREQFRIAPPMLEREIVGRGLSALLASNPCNPTGQLVEGNELAEWVRIARDNRCTMILDEFYSHYIYTENDGEGPKMVSAAAFVEDVNEDPIIIVDGLTKNWRYPGWRVSWTVGPEEVIETVASAGSFLDGGANNPFQHQVVPLLSSGVALQETVAVQATFRQKRDYMLTRLDEMGIVVPQPPQGTFYCWADLSQLPAPLNDGMQFFEAALQERVITVPGVFFDVNPGKRRSNARYQHFVRLSFGPEMAQLERGLDGLARLVAKQGSAAPHANGRAKVGAMR
ncbi:MAG: pyridoxal phosphate-dependent aminotransferase [Anaerolineales bacterium]|nr:pyridoxal phosphate-dependent aminotransferase [Anaerolineales bacterium]MCB9128971.1 pyridoxal phosphate-dependent aminotransferase [Ardenticatenales bacterium]